MISSGTAFRSSIFSRSATPLRWVSMRLCRSSSSPAWAGSGQPPVAAQVVAVIRDSNIRLVRDGICDGLRFASTPNCDCV